MQLYERLLLYKAVPMLWYEYKWVHRNQGLEILQFLSFVCPQLKMKITDFENRRSFKSIWLNSQFREEVKLKFCMMGVTFCLWKNFLFFFNPLIFGKMFDFKQTWTMHIYCRRSPSTLTSTAVCGTFWKNVKRQWSLLKMALRSSGIYQRGVIMWDGNMAKQL